MKTKAAKAAAGANGLPATVLAKAVRGELKKIYDSANDKLQLANAEFSAFGNQLCSGIVVKGNEIFEAEATLQAVQHVGNPADDGSDFSEWLATGLNASAEAFSMIYEEEKPDDSGLLKDWCLARATAYCWVFNVLKTYLDTPIKTN